MSAPSYSFHADRRVTRESVPTLTVPAGSIYVCGFVPCSSPAIDGHRCARHLGMRPTPVPTVGHVDPQREWLRRTALALAELAKAYEAKHAAGVVVGWRDT